MTCHVPRHPHRQVRQAHDAWVGRILDCGYSAGDAAGLPCDIAIGRGNGRRRAPDGDDSQLGQASGVAMVEYLMARGDEELYPANISAGAWWAHMRRGELRIIDERDEKGVGLIRILGQVPYMRGEAIFHMPEDAEKYRQFIGG